MTTTTVERNATSAGARAGQATGPAGGFVLDPPRPRRRWGLLAGMAALVCVGALGNVWLHQVTTNAQRVLAARTLIERGGVITREELMSVEIGPDPALRTVPAEHLDALVGKRASVDVAAGSLLAGDVATEANLPSQGHALVGVGVPPAMMPGVTLRAGDRIRVVATPGLQGDASSGAPPMSVQAVVVSTATGSDTNGQGPQTVITVDVPTGDAAQLAALAATGKVAVVLDSRDR